MVDIQGLRQSYDLGRLPDEAVLEFGKEINDRMNTKSEQQIINELKRKYNTLSSGNQEDFARRSQRPMVLSKWQEILKKKKELPEHVKRARERVKQGLPSIEQPLIPQFEDEERRKD